MRTNKLIGIALLILFFPLAARAAHNVLLTITDTTNPAGTTYNIYRGTGACSSSPTLAKIGSSTTKTFTDPNVAAGTYCYAATAVNSIGDESAQSPTAQGIVAAAPNTVTITVTVQ